MQRYQTLGMQLRLKRVESGLHQKTLGVLLGGATQALVSWWESGQYAVSDEGEPVPELRPSSAPGLCTGQWVTATPKAETMKSKP
jgi:hypothetical protein